MISSINYWKNPIYNSSRRYIDIIIAVSNIIYHISICNTFLQKMFFIVGTMMYPINTLFCIYDKIYFSIFFHMLLHILISLSAIYLYLT